MSRKIIDFTAEERHLAEEEIQDLERQGWRVDAVETYHHQTTYHLSRQRITPSAAALGYAVARPVVQEFLRSIGYGNGPVAV
jgi:hypothetical protein